MQKITPYVIYIGGFLVLILSGLDMFWTSHDLLPNPDPNHIHADFAVWVNGQRLDFSDARYMSVKPTTSFLPSVIPVAHAHLGEEVEEHMIPGREYLHLHDGNGFVIHRHKPGLTLGDFFSSIGLTMTKTCLKLDDFQYRTLDRTWVRDFGVMKNLCTNGKFHWTMFVNGKGVQMNPDYVFEDLDQILLSYSAGDDFTKELGQMTSDACKYSLRCPWKGTPPKENCIADPAIPCTIPVQ